MASAYADDRDIESLLHGGGADKSVLFAEQAVRLGFIRKVFGLLCVQLAITAGVGAAFIAAPPLKAYVLASPWLFLTCFAASLGLVVFLSCSESARRSHPTNLICLFAFTLCEAVLVGVISASYDTPTVVLAAGLTVGITGCLAAYAMQTKRDFTASGGILFSCLFALIAGGIVSMFWRNQVLNIAISAIGAAVFACYIVFDVQLMVGGGKLAISPDEYVFAALNIYLDIINLFLYLLRLLQAVQGDNN